MFIVYIYYTTSNCLKGFSMLGEGCLTVGLARMYFFNWLSATFAAKDVSLSRNLEALISILKVVVGTGILALPLAFHLTGIIGGPILTLLIIAWLIYGIHILVFLFYSMYSVACFPNVVSVDSR